MKVLSFYFISGIMYSLRDTFLRDHGEIEEGKKEINELANEYELSNKISCVAFLLVCIGLISLVWPIGLYYDIKNDIWFPIKRRIQKHNLKRKRFLFLFSKGVSNGDFSWKEKIGSYMQIMRLYLFIRLKRVY